MKMNKGNCDYPIVQNSKLHNRGPNHGKIVQLTRHNMFNLIIHMCLSLLIRFLLVMRVL